MAQPPSPRGSSWLSCSDQPNLNFGGHQEALGEQAEGSKSTRFHSKGGVQTEGKNKSQDSSRKRLI